MKYEIIITKQKIKRYLEKYKDLSGLIKRRERRWILGKGPTLDEWMEGRNTVEKQAINLIEDKKLNELRFFKKNIDKYLLRLKFSKDKSVYKYIIYRYVKEDSEEKLEKIFGKKNLRLLEEKSINYLYINLKRELKKNEN